MSEYLEINKKPSEHYQMEYYSCFARKSSFGLLMLKHGGFFFCECKQTKNN